MATIPELRTERINKLDELNKIGISAYPSLSKRTHNNSEALSNFETLSLASEKVVLSGRVMSKRGQGALAFLDIHDGTAKFQIIAKSPDGDNVLDFVSKFVDVGDFMEFEGTLALSNTGQPSQMATGARMLSKSLLPLPDKHHGLQDEELKMRYRYLEMLMNENLKSMMVRKAMFWGVTRSFLTTRGFLEVDTPTLEVTTGGAEANPFATHHRDFDMNVFLRISAGELWQKRLLAAGFPRTFEIGRVYRNEGSSPNHLQEFMNCEFYMAYANFSDGMEMTKDLYREIAKNVYGKTEFTHAGQSFDLASEWEIVDYENEILKQTGINIYNATDDEIKDKLKSLHVSYDGVTRERLLDTLWKYCRKHISGPAFLTGHPLIMGPLAKTAVDGKTVEKFQVILAGTEIGNGYSELNDPIEQAKRFVTQKELIQAGDEEAMMSDDDFVIMLEHGMPPACGFGFGQRLFAFLEGVSIRETETFPLIKPKSI